jgi:hypothetical protein
MPVNVLSGATLHQHLADMTNGFGRIQSFRTNCYTIHNAATAENAEGIFQVSQTLIGMGISAIREKAIGLQQTGRANKFFRIPPE